MRGRMLGLMVALIVGPLCAETVQMVRVHPWLTRGAGEEAVLGFRGLVPSAGKHSVSLPVRFRLEHCTADDFTSFRLFRQPATATAAANECSIGQSFSYALPHFGEPRQTASESLRWQNGPAEATDFTLTFDNGIDATLQAGDSLWVVVNPKVGISPEATLTVELAGDVRVGETVYAREAFADPAADGVHRIYPFRHRIGAYTKADLLAFWEKEPSRLATLTEVLVIGNGSAPCEVVEKDGAYVLNVSEGYAATFRRLKELRAAHHPALHLKVVTNGSPEKSAALRQAMNDTYRSAFVASVISALEALGADGLDVDWEYCATAGQFQNYAKTMGALKDAFFARGWELSAAIAAYYRSQPKGTLALFDYINVMAYDGTSLNAPFRLQRESVETLRDTRAVPARRLVMGQAIYGNDTNTWSQPGWATVVGQPGYTGDDCDACPFREVLQTFTGPTTYRGKVRACLEWDLGGVMSWGYYSDIEWTHSQSLGRAQAQVIWPRTAWDWPTPETAADGTVTLRTEEDWFWFADHAADVKMARLGADIVFSHDPRPVPAFSGVLEGEGHTLTLPKDTWIVSYDEAALFIHLSGTVRDLTVDCSGRIISRRDRKQDAGTGRGNEVRLTTRGGQGACAGLLSAYLNAGATVERVRLILRKGAELRGQHEVGALTGQFYTENGAITVREVSLDLAGTVTSRAVDSLGNAVTMTANADVGGLVGQFNWDNAPAITFSDCSVILRPTARLEARDGSLNAAGGAIGNLNKLPADFLKALGVTWCAGASITSSSADPFRAQPWIANRNGSAKASAPSLAAAGSLTLLGGNFPWTADTLWIRETVFPGAIRRITLTLMGDAGEEPLADDLATALMGTLPFVPSTGVHTLRVVSEATAEALHLFSGIAPEFQGDPVDGVQAISAEWTFAVTALDLSVPDETGAHTLTVEASVSGKAGAPADYAEGTEVSVWPCDVAGDTAEAPLPLIATDASEPGVRVLTFSLSEPSAFFRLRAER